MSQTFLLSSIFIILRLFLPLQVSSWFINEQDFSSHGAGSARLLSMLLLFELKGLIMSQVRALNPT